MWNIWITVAGIAFVFLMTTLGAAVVFFFKGEISKRLHTFFLGLASGVMIAAAIWSLLLPALAQADTLWGFFAFFPVGTGILFGGAFLILLDSVTPKWKEKHFGGEEAGDKSARLFFAVTLHNIPEGLAVGFAFGAASVIGTTAAFLSALGLAIGIGVQNFPEGAAISLPLKSVLRSNRKAFFWGAISGVAEPIFAVTGYFLAAYLLAWQPWFLSFAAGAMLFVAAEDLIPDAKSAACPYLGALGVLIGFVGMMVLDVALA